MDNFDDFKLANNEKIKKEEVENILKKYEAIVIDYKDNIDKAEEKLKDILLKSSALSKYLLIIIYPSHIVIHFVNPEEFMSIYRMLKTKIIPVTIVRGMKYESYTALILIEYGGYFLPYNLSLDQVENVQNYISSPVFVKSIIRVLSSLRQVEQGYTLSTVILAFITGMLIGITIFAKILTIL